MPLLERIGPDLNAFSLSFDENLLGDIRTAFQRCIEPYLTAPENASLLQGGEINHGPLGTNDQQYYFVSYDREPLLWVSNANWHTYNQFKEIFDSLNIDKEIEQLVDFNEKIVLYSGFFVVGNHAPNENWHLDYAPGANAYTLITPLFNPSPGHGNLLYKDTAGAVNSYPYKLGEAVIVGDQFSHSTETYSKTESLRVLLSLTFGSDKIEYWNTLKQTIGGQSKFLILPCGHQLNHCLCPESI